jgi:steroid 5-alpha reductase family enzyme
MTTTPDWVVLIAAAVAVLVLMAVTALAARRTGRWSVVDVTWGLGFLVVATLALVLGDGDLLRRGLLFGLPAAWALRLASHIFGRARGEGEDPRYAELKQNGRGGFLGQVLLPQGLAIFFVSLPIQVGVASDAPVGPLAWVGVAVWLVGLAFEAIGDAQLKAFKAEDANQGKVMDRGLWAWTRHPNYFGDACVWWGIYLVAADSGWAGAATILSPVVMTYFLVAATGAKLLERTMMKRDGYPEYAARTSMFLPLPPKRGAGGPGTRKA